MSETITNALMFEVLKTIQHRSGGLKDGRRAVGVRQSATRQGVRNFYALLGAMMQTRVERI